MQLTTALYAGAIEPAKCPLFKAELMTMPDINLQQLFRSELALSKHTLETLDALAPQLERATKLVADCMRGGGKLLTCGNGGSATDASHLATEFIIRFKDDRKPLPAICLCDSGSALTAACNDYGFEYLFERQVRGLGKPGDVLVAFSTSGNSKNVLRAIEAANRIAMKTISFLGRGGGAMKGLADVELLVESELTARTQEAHLILYHGLCTLLEAELGGVGGAFLHEQ